LRTADGSRLLITAATPAPSLLGWREKDDMPNVRPSLIGDRHRLTRFDDLRRRGGDRSRDRDKGDVQRRRCCELPERSEAKTWQLWRARFEWVQIEHDEMRRSVKKQRWIPPGAQHTA
jgi:hypothetical protein